MNLLLHEKALLYVTYQEIATAGIELIDSFYQRLFEIDPNLQSLFRVSMQDQGVKWRLMLISLIAAIDQPSKLRASMRNLGQRHVNYGVKSEDYPKLVEAFLWSLHQYLGAAFTSEMEIAWRKFFTIIVDDAIHDNYDYST